MIAPQAAAAHPPRPPLALRVGISGARKLRADQIGRLQTQLDELLGSISGEMRCLAAALALRDIYALATSPEPALRFLSPLARGSDRLAAGAALAQGFSLHVPMPFPEAEYRRDFKGAERPDEPPLTAAQDNAAFDALLARAAGRTELDGARGDAENRSYEAVGRFVVRNCDLLIAIWDGGPGGGRGGTADIVRYAASVGVPVCWVHATQATPPRWIDDAEDLRDPDSAPEAPALLARYIARLVRPPRLMAPHHHSPFDRIGEAIDAGVTAARRAWRRWRQLPPPGPDSPWSAYFEETHLGDARPWRAYDYMLRRMAGEPQRGARRPASWPGTDGAGDPVAWWEAQYAPPDELATSYADRYRGAYVWVFSLAAIAVLLGALLLGLGGYEWMPHAALLVFALLELAALVTISALVIESTRRGWHGRSIDYRLLAELCRAQSLLAPIGWSVATGAAQGAVADRAARLHLGLAPRERPAWVAWLFGALQRAAPLPQGALDSATLQRLRVAGTLELLDGQLQYHAIRRRRMQRTGVRLESLGVAIFLAVLALVVCKLAIYSWEGPEEVAHVFGLFATILPGFSAAFVGLRAYAEMELLAAQSRRMRRRLAAAKGRILRLDLAVPLASQDLGAETERVATVMLQDLEGWAQLSGVKSVEAG